MSKIAYDLNEIRAIVFDVDGVLSPSTVLMGRDGVPRRMVNLKDDYAIQFAARNGLKMAIITGADSAGIIKRYNTLGIKDVFTQVSMKLRVLQRWMMANGFTPDQVAYVGDDVPDFECMQHVGLSVAPSDAATDIRMIAKYVSPVQGGYGVARDLIEEVLRAQGRWTMGEDAFGW